jgi:hypothetical protein
VPGFVNYKKVLSTRSLKEEFEDNKGAINPYIKEEQTKQWPKEKAQKDKQRPTKHTHKTKDQVTRPPFITNISFISWRSVYWLRITKYL